MAKKRKPRVHVEKITLTVLRSNGHESTVKLDALAPRDVLRKAGSLALKLLDVMTYG